MATAGKLSSFLLKLLDLDCYALKNMPLMTLNQNKKRLILVSMMHKAQINPNNKMYRHTTMLRITTNKHIMR